MSEHQRISLTFRQQTALARLVHELRPDWDVPGIEAALGKVRNDSSAYELAVAALRASWRHENRTPAIIALPGPHWRSPDPAASSRPAAPTRGEQCTYCGHVRARCEQISRLPGDGHAFTPDTGTGELLDPNTGELLATPDPSDQLARIRAQLNARQGTPEGEESA